MCCVFGLVSPRPLKESIDIHQVLPKLFKESQIRGKHATGITYRGPQGLITISAPFAADRFCRGLLSTPVASRELGEATAFIAHCRYSTSDLDFNQPIADEELSLVHNGVMTQTAPETWPEQFGMTFKTRNDTEILFNHIKAGKAPWTILPESSQACIALSQKRFTFWRNTKRPLWSSKLAGNVWAVASTADVIMRGLDSVAVFVEPDYIYAFDGGRFVKLIVEQRPERRDLQR